MNLLGLIKFGGGSIHTPSAELPDVFPFPIEQKDFVASDVQTLYTRILTDVVERTQGIKNEQQSLLWDNCLANESTDGLITMLAKAMADKSSLFIVYDSGIKLVRKAKPDEEAIIRNDYKARGESSTGAYITFAQYRLTDMLKLYSALEYCTISGLYKASNVAKTVQFKYHDLRASISSVDGPAVAAQAKAIADAMSAGKDIAIDAKDVIASAMPDVSPVESTVTFINQKRSFYLGLPAAWITGLSNKGLGDSGQGEMKAVERGLRRFYFSILKPVIESLFSVKTSFKSDDYESLSTALQALQSFEIVGEELISADDKKLIISRLFGLSHET